MKRFVPVAASLAVIAGLCVTIAAFADPDIGGPLMGRIIKLERAIWSDAQVANDITIASTKALSAATLSTTGTVTVALTASAGSVVASPLVNLPTGSTTNAVFFKIKIGTTTYAVPAYAQP